MFITDLLCVRYCSVWQVIWWSVGHRLLEVSTPTGDMYRDGGSTDVVNAVT